MTDKKGLLVVFLFMLFWMYGLHTLFDPFSGPAFLFQEIASLVRRISSRVNRLMNKESMMLMLKM